MPAPSREELDSDMMKWYGELQTIRATQVPPKREEIAVEVQQISLPKVVETPPIKVIENQATP